MSDNQELPIKIPELDTLPVGDFSLGAPEKNDAVQVQLVDPNADKLRLHVHIADNVIEISREDSKPLQVEAQNQASLQSVHRTVVFGQPVGKLTLNRLHVEDGEQWAPSSENLEVLDVGNLCAFLKVVADQVRFKDKEKRLKGSIF